MKVTFEFNDEQDDSSKIARMSLCDKAFSTLWDIDEALRRILKYEEIEIPDNLIEKLEQIRTEINESHLLDYYN